MADLLETLRSIDRTLTLWFFCWAVMKCADEIKEWRRSRG